MLTKQIQIAAPNGLHARPVGELVKLVKTFPETKVTLSTPARTVNAASMLSILSLGLKCGTEVTVGIYVRCRGTGNGAWGKIDDAMLNSVP